MDTSGRSPDVSILLPTMLQAMGTMRYASPEQMFGSPPNPRDDVYALGIIAYQMVLGDLKATPGTDAVEILRGLRVPPDLITLITKSVAMDPLRRPESARDWERTLRQWMPKKPKPGLTNLTPSGGTSTVFVPLGPVPVPGAPVPPPPPPSADAPLPMTTNYAPQTTASVVAAAAVSLADVPLGPVDPNAPQTFVLNVPGAILARPVGESESGWKEVVKTPATVTLEPGTAYCIRVKETATDRDVEGLAAAAGFGAIEAVNFAWCEHLTDAGLAHVRELTSLRNLDLMGCKRVTFAGMVHLAKMSELTHLSLRWCALVTDVGLQVMRRLPALQALDLMGCSRITDAGLLQLKVLSQLRHLNLRWCELITDAGLAHLKGLTQLRYLNLWNCTAVTDAGVAAFKAAVPECHIDKS
jgi:hypothetical protein